MTQALYSKYRPKTFNDVVGQKQILKTLKNAINANKISHAYMFCGPRGTGKTTMARLLSKACMCKKANENGIPVIDFCGTCQNCKDIAAGSHPDVYELDAASRTGVENVRDEIISRVGFAATKGSKKIYIIDEVHMLSTAAFNALLKTLEEPPEHVIFILCTTDPQKVPDTILSRCQRFDFSSISINDIVERLKYVCSCENVEAEQDALKKIAENCQGAMRNALTKLEQLISFTNGNITLKNLEENSIGQNSDLSSLIEALGIRSHNKIFELIDKMCKRGVDFDTLTNKIICVFRDMYVKNAGAHIDIIYKNICDDYSDLFITERLNNILNVLSDLVEQLKTSSNLRLTFEVAMIKIANPKSDLTLQSLAERISNLEYLISDNKTIKGNHLKGKNIQSAPKKIISVVENNKNSAEITNQMKKIEDKQEYVFENNFKEIPTDDIKIPEFPTETNFSQERKNLKQQVNKDFDEQDGYSTKEIAIKVVELWKKVYINIRKKHAPIAAILITGSPSYDEQTNQFVLTFPQSASFSVGVLKKPDCINQIHEEIKKVMGNEVGFNVHIDKNIKNEFEPQFINNFRNDNLDNEKNNDDLINIDESKSYASVDNHVISSNLNEKNNDKSISNEPSRHLSAEQTNTQQINDKAKSITDMLNSFGAYNITEE